MKKNIFLISLLAISLGAISCRFSPKETEQNLVQAIDQDSLKQAIKQADEKRAAEQLDSLINYHRLSDSLAQKYQWKNAAIYLDSARMVSTEAGSDSLMEKRASFHFRAHQYELAISDYTVLIRQGVHYSENLYQRALCYQKQGKTQLAVNDLKEAITRGHDAAEKLHNKINPERKRVAYYVTRCRDGSTSSAKGRGACSHHGGVRNWNEPVYETYRKY